jgi:hypothetical protein
MTTLETKHRVFAKKSTIAEMYDDDEFLFRVSVKFGDSIPDDAKAEMRGWLSGAVADEIEFRLDPEASIKKSLGDLLNGISEGL